MSKTLTADHILDIREIYLEPEVYNYERGREILNKYPDAKLTEVRSHWNIPSLHGNEGSAEDWLYIKKHVLVLGVKKSLTARPNTRSSDFVAPSLSNGCAMACSYCYVPRHKGFANPISMFVNTEQIAGYLKRHAARQGIKNMVNTVDPLYWVYDIGENADCSVDAGISDNVKDMVTLFRNLPNAKASFATKFVNPDLLSYDPQGKTRIRFSLMPQSVARVVDVRTSKISERIEAVNSFAEAGYEVHFNFSPVIWYPDWIPDYINLFEEINDKLSPAAKKQLKCEVIFLTHNDRLHDVNMKWHPHGEAYLWQPSIQETKQSETGGFNLRYKTGFKGDLVRQFTGVLQKYMPYCEIRYAF